MKKTVWFGYLVAAVEAICDIMFDMWHRLLPLLQRRIGGKQCLKS